MSQQYPPTLFTPSPLMYMPFPTSPFMMPGTFPTPLLSARVGGPLITGVSPNVPFTFPFSQQPSPLSGMPSGFSADMNNGMPAESAFHQSLFSQATYAEKNSGPSLAETSASSNNQPGKAQGSDASGNVAFQSTAPVDAQNSSSSGVSIPNEANATLNTSAPSAPPNKPKFKIDLNFNEFNPSFAPLYVNNVAVPQSASRSTVDGPRLDLPGISPVSLDSPMSQVFFFISFVSSAL